MKKENVKFMLVIAGALLFNAIFWKEKLGINTVIFDIFIISSIFYLYSASRKNPICRWLIIGHAITAATVLVHNTVLSETAFFVTLFLFIAFSQYLHRSALYAGGSVLLNYIFLVPNFLRYFFQRMNGKIMNIPLLYRSIRKLFVPLVILTVFAVIYAFANPVFSNMISTIAVRMHHWFENIFNWLSLPRLGFFIFGIIITAGLIYKARNSYFSHADLNHQDIFARRRNNFARWKQSSFSDLLSVVIGKSARGLLALKSEFGIGLISLGLLNGLLLVINILDIKYVWLGFTFSQDVNLSAYVHEGAGLLIFSIVLAMTLLLFIFRGNLNFYKKNKWLKYGAYLWIFQNGVLVISVFIRDYYYVAHYGLAYKRIGLLFFLAMVLAGLITLLVKIRYTKTVYYLIRVNGWVAVLLLIMAATVHWDYTIADYNLSRKSVIPLDVPFLLSLSDKTLPLIEKNKDVLDAETHIWRYDSDDTIGYSAREFFENRKSRFLQRQKNYTWLSWNMADEYVQETLHPFQISLQH